MASPNIKFEALPTPNPEEVSIRVWQDANQISADTIPTIGMAYKDTKLPSRPRVETFGEYVYTFMSKEGDDLWFYFGKPKTQLERDTPFRVFSGTRQHTWDAVLEDLYAVRSTFPQTVNNGTATSSTPSIFSRYRYRPAVSYNSVVIIEQFLAPTPWPRSAFIHEQPVPTDVNGSYVGIPMKFERCLHDICEFPELVPGASVIYGVGTKMPPVGRNPARQIFPATNFVDWAPFYLADDQQPVNGLFLRERVKIFPPPIPATIFT